MKKNLYNFIKKITLGLFVFQILLGGSLFTLLSTPQKVEAAEECIIQSFNVKQEIFPVGAVYTRNNPPALRATFRAKDCIGKTLSFELWEKDLPAVAGAAGLITGWFTVGAGGVAAAAMVTALYNESEVVASTSHTVQHQLSRIIIDYKLGEDQCEFSLITKDCELYLRVLDGNNTITETPGYSNNVAYDCYPGVLCDDDVLFSVLSKEETDLGGAGLSDLNEIPEECQDAQGNLRPGCYKLLEPISGFIDPVFDAETQGIGGYVNTIIRLLLAVATLLAVLMIVVGGVQYMTTDAFTQKSEGISKMTNAVLGLILAFAVYVILNTINPNILNLDPGIKSVSLTLEGDTNAPLVSSPYVPAQTYCPKAGGSAVFPQIIASLQGKVTYRFGGKGGPPPYTSDTQMCENPAGLCRESCPTNTVCLDCSGFVNYTLKCAGLTTYNGGTDAMFTNAEIITSISENGASVNNIVLKPGDIVGWKAGDGGNQVGHVLLYIGDGKVIESRGGEGRLPGNALKTTNLKDHSKKESLKYIKRAS